MDGVTSSPCKQIFNAKGDIYHALKKTDDTFAGFGEAYFSHISEGEVKGWKNHREMTLNIVVPMGEVAFVIYDDRNESDTKGTFKHFVLSPNNYQRLSVSPGLGMGFKGLGAGVNMLLNIASIVHDPQEANVKDINDIPYNWDALTSA